MNWSSAQTHLKPVVDFAACHSTTDRVRDQPVTVDWSQTRFLPIQERTMKFMLIANATKDSEAGAPPDPRLMADIAELSDEMAKAGVLTSTGGLAPSSMGAKVRLSRGKVVVTDGPFAESKEVIGGYAIIDVGSKEEAIAFAKRFWQLHADVMGPSYEGGGEIRHLFYQSECGPRPEQLGQ
jgi:hypothetical protein